MVAQRILNGQISVFGENFGFGRNSRILMKILDFGETLDFCGNLGFQGKFRLLAKISNFEFNFEFWRKSRISTKILDFVENLGFR